MRWVAHFVYELLDFVAELQCSIELHRLCFKVRSFPVLLKERKILMRNSFFMNTDASNVEDINIPQIIERLSMSCMNLLENGASFEE